MSSEDKRCSRGIVFTADALFMILILTVSIVVFGSLFYREPSTSGLREIALDEMTNFDKNGTFENLLECPADRNQQVQDFLASTVSALNYNSFGFMNVSVYESDEAGGFIFKCGASGSVGTWTDTRSASRRIVSFVDFQTSGQLFGLAELVVGD